MKKIGSLLLGILLLCMMFPARAFAEGEPADLPPLTPVSELVDANGNVIFNDAFVESAFRNALGVPDKPITKKQLAAFGANGQELIIESPTPATADLSVLQLCASVKTLWLIDVTPTSLSAIPSMKSLGILYLKNVQITDLNFLTGAKRITDIWVGGCPITDISAVTSIPQLVNFSIDTPVPDVTYLYECRKLSGVAVTGLTDVQVNTLLEKMGGRLISLGLNNCSITDQTLERICRLKLYGFMLDNAPVTSIKPIWNMKTLQFLEIFNIPISSLDGIQRCVNLREVYLANITDLKDYTPLFQATNLRKLKIAGSMAPDLEGIQNLKNLKVLTLDTLNGRVKMTPVYALNMLDQLILNHVRIDTFYGIEGLVALTKLSIFELHGIQDYTPLSGLKYLKSVSTDIPDELPAGLPVN